MSTHIQFTRIESAIRFLKENVHLQPSLEETAAHVHLSPFHFQRLFTEWAGIAPKKFLQYLTLEELKKNILSEPNLLSASYQTGLSSSSRAHDLFVTLEAVTPGDFKKMGAGLEIEYGIHDTPFGNCLIGITARGVCYMGFVDENVIPEKEISIKWPGATFTPNTNRTAEYAQRIFISPGSNPVTAIVRGTPFQVKVWEALLKIPFGNHTDYSAIAKCAGTGATRAVGSAIGANPLAYLIPCHRVIRKEGIIGQYHWGSFRKAAMLGWEKSKSENIPENMAR